MSFRVFPFNASKANQMPATFANKPMYELSQTNPFQKAEWQARFGKSSHTSGGPTDDLHDQ